MFYKVFRSPLPGGKPHNWRGETRFHRRLKAMTAVEALGAFGLGGAAPPVSEPDAPVNVKEGDGNRTGSPVCELVENVKLLAVPTLLAIKVICGPFTAAVTGELPDWLITLPKARATSAAPQHTSGV